MWRFLATLLVSVFFMPFAHAQEATATIDYNEDDVILLARLISAEARGEEYEGHLAVGNVVLNRLKTGRWGDTLRKVIYAKGQFARPKGTYSDECYRAAKAALAGERVVPEYVIYFQRAKVDYFYAPWYCTIGSHNYYGHSEDT